MRRLLLSQSLFPLFTLTVLLPSQQLVASWETPPYAKLPNPIKEKKPIKLTQLVILTDPSRVSESLSPDKLSTFLTATQQNIAACLGVPNENFTLIIHTQIHQKAKPRLKISLKGAAQGETLQKISQHLKSLPDIRSRGPTLKYEAHFEIQAP